MTPRAVVLALVVFSLSVVMLAAAHWQYQRGEARRDAREQADRTMAAPATAVAADDLPATEGREHAALTGRYRADRQILLDNQTSGGSAGYHVWTPLVTDSGDWVIVDRGWIAAPADRTALPQWPTPTGPVRVTGRWSALPRPGLVTGGNPCDIAEFPARLHYPTPDALACVLGQQPVAGRLLLDPDAADGFLRNWTTSGLPPERHFGYAVQWLGLTLALWILTWIGWRRRAS